MNFEIMPLSDVARWWRPDNKREELLINKIIEYLNTVVPETKAREIEQENICLKDEVRFLKQQKKEAYDEIDRLEAEEKRLKESLHQLEQELYYRNKEENSGKTSSNKA